MTIRSKRRKRNRRRHPGTTGPEGLASQGQTTGDDRESDDSAATGILQTHADVRLLSRLRRRRDWLVPDESFEQIPANLHRLATDVHRKASIQIGAAKELRAMQRDNWQRDRSEINVSFHPQVLGAMAPRSPARDDEDNGTDPKPVAYLEKITEVQARETLRVLIEANQLHHVIDQDQLPEHLRGPINDFPNWRILNDCRKANRCTRTS